MIEFLIASMYLSWFSNMIFAKKPILTHKPNEIVQHLRIYEDEKLPGPHYFLDVMVHHHNGHGDLRCIQWLQESDEEYKIRVKRELKASKERLDKVFKRNATLQQKEKKNTDPFLEWLHEVPIQENE